MFVNTETRRKRFFTFQFCAGAATGCLGGNPPNPAPIQQHPTEPRGKGAFTPGRGAGQPSPVGAGWDPTRVVGGRGNRPSPGSKPTWSMHRSPGCCQSGGRAGCPPQGHGRGAAFCSSLPSSAFLCPCKAPTLGFPAREGASRPLPCNCHENHDLLGRCGGAHPCPGKERSLPLRRCSPAAKRSQRDREGVGSGPRSEHRHRDVQQRWSPWVVLPVGRNHPFYGTDSKPQQMSL